MSVVKAKEMRCVKMTEISACPQRVDVGGAEVVLAMRLVMAQARTFLSEERMV